MSSVSGNYTNHASDYAAVEENQHSDSPGLDINDSPITEEKDKRVAATAEAFKDTNPASRRPGANAGIAAMAATSGAPGQVKSAAASGDAAATEPPPLTAARKQAQKQAQQQLFATFADGVDPEVQKRLSTWLPDAFAADEKVLKETMGNLNEQQRSDLNALAKQQGGDELFPTASEEGVQVATAALFNKNAFTELQQRFGEHTLKESTPGLAPATSYDTGSTLEASKDAVYEKFVSGVDEAAKKQLATWLPDALADRSKLPNDLNAEQGAAIHKLAIAHGLEKADLMLRSLVTAYDRQEALATAGELPTVVDMMLVQHDGKGRDTAVDLKVAGDDINARVALYEKEGFGDLDSWLPAALVGNGEIPKGDAEAMKLLGRFAENMGLAGGATATPEAAFAYLEKSGVIEKALHPGSTDKDKSFLLFTDSFLDTTLKYGAKNGAVNGEMVADTANAAEILLGPDDGSGTPRQVETQALAAAVLHRTDQPLERQQELMAAAGYINKAETLGKQKARLAQSLLAFHVREEVGTAPMTARQWGDSYSEIHPDLVGQLNERAFNSPTSQEMQIITAHLGVPGDHKFMIDEKRKIKMSNDELGNVESFDQSKKKTKWYKSVIDIAVPVIATALTFTGWGTAAGVAMNAAYSAYKGAEAIKNGDLLGGALAIAGGVTGGAASYLGSAATTATSLAKGVAVANGALNGYRAAENGDVLGVFTSGLSAASAYTGQTGYQSTANGVNAGRALEDGDYLAAGAGFASVASDLSRPTGNGIARHTDESLTYGAISQGLNLAGAIDDKNYAGIGGALSNGIQQFGENYEDQQTIKAAREKEAAFRVEYDLPEDPFEGLGDLMNLNDIERETQGKELRENVKTAHEQLNAKASELDKKIAAIDEQMQNHDTDLAVANELGKQQRKLQSDREFIGIKQSSLREQTYALAAHDAYMDDSNLVGTHLKRLSADDLRKEGFQPELLQYSESGYFAAVYKDEVSGDIIIANRGSEMTGNDWQANLEQGFGIETEQYQQALRVGLEAKHVFGADHNVVFTGHSLGGALAAEQALAFDGQASTANSAGLHDDTLQRLGVTRDEAQNRINAYNIKGEPLSFIQDSVGLGPLDPLAGAVGQRTPLPTVNSNGDPAGLLRQIFQTKDLHGVDAFREGLNDHFRDIELAQFA